MAAPAGGPVRPGEDADDVMTIVQGSQYRDPKVGRTHECYSYCHAPHIFGDLSCLCQSFPREGICPLLDYFHALDRLKVSSFRLPAGLALPFPFGLARAHLFGAVGGLVGVVGVRDLAESLG